MFSREGIARSDRQNRALAGSLAFVGGFANAVGFVVFGIFTSHVTGNVGKIANDVSRESWQSAGEGLSLVGAFFLGALFVSAVVESEVFVRRSHAYAIALFAEACLLAFFGYARESGSTLAHALCLAMGLQNGLVTRLLGAVVRTTHLTGVVTDLGIESARWIRHSLRARSAPAVEAPPSAKILLLATIALAFLAGAVAGAAAAERFGRSAMSFAVVAVSGCALIALSNGRARPLGPLPATENAR